MRTSSFLLHVRCPTPGHNQELLQPEESANHNEGSQCLHSPVAVLRLRVLGQDPVARRLISERKAPSSS